MKKLFIYILCLCLLLSGCGSAGSISTFTIRVENMPTNFDPQIAYQKEDILVITNIFDGLFEKVGDDVNPVLAERYTVSPDGKTYTIKLRQDRVYHYRVKNDRREKFDEIPVTAQDFVFALQRVLSPRTQSPYAEDFLNIKNAASVKNGAAPSALGVKATDDYTLVITLESRDYNFIEKLCSTAAYPCNQRFFESTGGAYGLSIENLLSNGPFRLNYIDNQNGNATIVRADGISGGIDRIRLKQIDADRQAEAYGNENIDGYFAYSGLVESYSNTSSYSFESANICLVMNNSSGFLANSDVRKSLGWYAYSFKNSGANPEAVKGENSVFPGAMTFAGEYINKLINSPSPAYMSADPVSLIRQSGVQTAGVESLTLLIPRDSPYRVIYENINQLWQRDLGVFFKTEYLPVSQIRQRVASKDYDIAFLPLASSNDTPYGILDIFSDYDENLSDVIRRARATTDEAGAARAISSAQNIIIEQAFAVPMGSEETVFYCRRYFKNVIINPFNQVLNLKRVTVN